MRLLPICICKVVFYLPQVQVLKPYIQTRKGRAIGDLKTKRDFKYYLASLNCDYQFQNFMTQRGKFKIAPYKFEITHKMYSRTFFSLFKHCLINWKSVLLILLSFYTKSKLLIVNFHHFLKNRSNLRDGDNVRERRIPEPRFYLIVFFKLLESIDPTQNQFF